MYKQNSNRFSIKHLISCDVIKIKISSYVVKTWSLTNIIPLVQTAVTFLLLANGHLGQDEFNVVQPLGETLVVVGLNVQARLQGRLHTRLPELVDLFDKVADESKKLQKGYRLTS